MDVRRSGAENFPLFGSELLMRDAMATYVRLRWPKSTAKEISREFGLTYDEARSVSLGQGSLNAIDKILRHPNGGWAVALPILGAVIGHGVDDFIASERRKHAQQALKERALLRDLRALAPSHRPASAELAAPRDGERRSFRGRLGSGD